MNKITKLFSLESLLRICISILIIGILFKIQRWLYVDFVIVLTYFAIAILYFVRFWKKEQVSLIDYVKLILVTSWAFNGALAILHLNRYFLGDTVQIFFTIFIIMTISSPNNDRKTSIKNIASIVVLGIAMCTTFVGAIFKVMHYPSGSILLTVGVLTIVIWILKDLFWAK